MKKILGLAVALIAVVAMLGTGTWAYFNDTLTVLGNTIQAGTLTMTVGGGTHNSAHIGAISGGLGGVKPGDKDNIVSWAIVNTGTLAGNLHFKLAVPDGAQVTPDTKTALKMGVKVAFWLDQGTLGTWDSGDVYVKTDGSTQAYAGGETKTIDGTIPDAAYAVLNNYTVSDALLASNISGNNGGAGTFKAAYYFPNSGADFFSGNSDNQYQGSGASFDMDFALVQTNATSAGGITPPAKLVVTAGNNQSVSSPNASAVITVQLQDASSVAVTAASNTTVALSSNKGTGSFSATLGGVYTPTLNITISTGSTSGSFYYKDSAASVASTLTASSAGLTSASISITEN